MNAVNGDAGDEDVTGLLAQRDRLLSEVAALKEQRDHAIRAANDLRRENTRLQQRIAELEDPST